MRRLPHGYTNESWADADVVHKHYVGPDCDKRLRTEVACLTAFAEGLPVPQVVAVDRRARVVATTRLPGTHGQELLDGARAADALAAAGRCLDRVHAATPPEEIEGDGDSVVHGDYGLQNLLLDPESCEVTAIVDWEFARLGPAIVDLAWTEWIVRMHHPAAVEHIDAFFEGYGRTPPWSDRHAEMVRRCTELRDFVETEAAVRLWTDRLAATTAWTE